MVSLLLSYPLPIRERLTATASILVDPAPVLAMGHCFYFPALGRVNSLVHCRAHIRGEALLTPQTLVLHFWALPDDLFFELDRTCLPKELTGVASYPLRCQLQPLAPASIWYYYTREGPTGLGISSLRLSGDSLKLRGNVTLTTYDAQHQLLSGYYEVRANDQRDPTSTNPATDATCTIILAGDFDYVKLKLA